MTHDSGLRGSRQDGLLWALDDAPAPHPATTGAFTAPTGGWPAANDPTAPAGVFAAGAPRVGDTAADIFGASAAQPMPHPSAVDVDDIFGGVPVLNRHLVSAPQRHPGSDVAAGPLSSDRDLSWSGADDGPAGMAVPARGFVPVVAEELPSHDSDASDGEASWFRDNVFGGDQPTFETSPSRAPSAAQDRVAFWRSVPGKVVAGVAAAAVVVAVAVFAPGMVSASPAPQGEPTHQPASVTPPAAEPEPVPEPPAARPQVWQGGSVPGYETAPTWTLQAGDGTARGMTRLGPVLVRPGALTLYDIASGAKVFEAETSQAVVKTFAAAAVSGGAATLFWVTGAGDVADSGDAVPARLWWNAGGKAASVPMSDGCDVSAAGTQPLVTCPDGSAWWLQPDGSFGKVGVGDGQVVLGVVDGAGVVVDDEGVAVVELVSGAVSRLVADAPAREGATLVPLRWLGMGAAGVVSVWGDAAAGMGGVVDVVVHDLSGAVTGQVSVPGAAVEAAHLGRGVGGARAFIGPVVVDLDGAASGERVWVLPQGCEAFDAAGVVTRVECADGVGVEAAGQVWLGATGVAATSADGRWAVVADEAGSMSGHARVG